MECTPISSIQRLTTAVYTKNPSLVHEDELANEALVKFNLCRVLGLEPNVIDDMPAVEVLLFKIIIETTQRRLADEQKERDRKGKSMLPSGLPEDHKLNPQNIG